MRIQSKNLSACSLFLLLVLVSTTTAQQDNSQIAVIVNPQNPLTSISLADLRRAFNGEKQSWGNNLPVFPIVRAPQARERQILLALVLRMSEAEYKQHWLKKVYSGEAPQEPVAVFSNGMQLEGIRAKKGGIALISLQDVREGVKVIKVEGLAPGSPDYPLK